MSKLTDAQRAAAEYAARGWSIFPTDRAKRPACRDWDGTSAPDAGLIQPGHTIALDCRKSGLVVIDLDVKHGIDGIANWQALGIDDSGALVSQTPSGGRHLIFRDPTGGVITNSNKGLPPGIDVRGNGYILLPPSEIDAPDSKGQYIPIGDWTHEPGFAPPALVKLLLEQNKGQVVDPAPGNGHKPANTNGAAGATPHTDSGAYWLGRYLPQATPGNRNDTGKLLALQLRDDGLPLADAEAIMRQYAGQVPVGDHPYTEDDAVRTARSIFRGAPRPTAQSRTRQVRQATKQAGQAPTGAPASEHPQAQKANRVTSAVLINALNQLGYYFRLNEADDSVELNGERITDVMRATMRSKLRDVGLSRHLAAAEDAWIMDAGRNRYHPVRQYLDGLKWDGANWITRLTEYFDDVPYRATNGKEHHLLPTYLRKWLIGAVARAYTGCQNAVLTLEGRQGLGKSRFAKWLCPIAGMYRDAPVNPDDKDSQTALLSAWIWEIGELGSTTRRSDVDALKGFLTRELVTVRPPYAHYDIKKQALANFLATVNNSSGFLSDPSGNRRFWAVTVRMIDWGYADLDVNQVWAEAAAAYRQGEEWTLSSDEAELAASQNEAFEVPDPIEDLLRKEYRLDPRNRTIWTPTAEILTNLQEHGLQGNTRANSMGLAATLKRLGFEKRRDPATDVRGYWGVWR